MKLFSCPHCHQLLFFESVTCVGCGRTLAFLPDRGVMSPLAEVAREAGVFWATSPAADGARYRLCKNATDHGVCNWAVPADDPLPFCRACRLNDVIPNLGEPRTTQGWHRLETAKRRLLYTLLELGLPVASKAEDPAGGLAFAFMADDPTGEKKVFTGHANGLVTINLAEADDAYREKMRQEMGESYRTVLGHFRHEIGHYYWQRLVSGGRFEAPFRERFGDERESYEEAKQHHYAHGPAPDWQSRFVSAYASMHPWEDWAETWAHYLHMTDTLETARAHGLVVKAQPEAARVRTPTLTMSRLDLRSFEDLVTGWVPVTVALNNLNRSMGLSDCYPFVLSTPAIEKLRFVHEVIEESAEHALGRGAVSSSRRSGSSGSSG
jgi:hypothetical protein